MQPGGPTAHLPGRRPAYECGIVRYTPNRRHALRPAGRSEVGDRRLTLCGLHAFPVSSTFSHLGKQACKTCAFVERARPSARAARPSTDLAELRRMLDVAALELARSSGAAGAARSPLEILAGLLAVA